MLTTFFLSMSLGWAAERQPVHQLQADLQPPASFPVLPSPSAGSPDITVYGYLPYWADDPLSVDFDSLTHVAWFSVGLTATGAVTGADGWEAIAEDLIAAARPAGTKVHLCVTLFNESDLTTLLTNAEHRTRAVTELAALVEAAGADGVNIDFEGVGAGSKAGLVSFTEEMQAAVDEVFLATPAVDWEGAYDYDALAAASDGLFIMAYDYHWSGGNPGPIAPLTGGGPWSSYAMDWTLNDYRTWGTPDDKIIMGLPLYGKEWPTASDAVPGVALGEGEAYTMAGILADLGSMDLRYDDVTDTPWAWTGSGQLWYDDPESLEIKLSWSVSEGVQGIGFWALGYDGGNVEFWEMVDSISGADVPDEPPLDDDTGDAPDTAEPDTEDSDTAEPDTGSSDDSGITKIEHADPHLGDECGCASTSPWRSGWWTLVPLIALRRRQN